MNKKLLYTSLAVLLVLASIIVLLLIKSNPSQDGTIDTLEDAPIIGEVQDVQEKRPDDIVEQAEETNTPDEKENAEKPQSKPATAKPKAPTAKPSASKPSTAKPATYEDFMNMSSEDQQSFVDSFPSMDDFFAWYNSVKEVYEQENAAIEVGDDIININQIIENKN